MDCLTYLNVNLKRKRSPSIMSGCLVLMLASFRSLGYITILKLNWSPEAVTLGKGQSKWELTALRLGIQLSMEGFICAPHC